MLSCHPSSLAKPSLAGNFIHTVAGMLGDYIESSKFFIGCLVQNPRISFEFYILKIYLIGWFPHHFGGALYFYKVEKTPNLAKRIAILLELLSVQTDCK